MVKAVKVFLDSILHTSHLNALYQRETKCTLGLENQSLVLRSSS